MLAPPPVDANPPPLAMLAAVSFHAIVRHPLYLGEEIAILGVVLQYLSFWALLILALQVFCQLYRMSCEEQVLGNTFPDYGAYKSRTFRLVPGVY